MTKKIKLKIIKVEDELTRDDVLIYKMTLESELGSYERGVRASDWDDERAQRSIKKTWLHEIGEIEAGKAIEESKTEGEIEVERKAKMKDIKGTVLEEDE